MSELHTFDDVKFDNIVCRRLVFSHPELSAAFNSYLAEHKEKGINDCGVSALRRVYVLHIRPYYHRMLKYRQEYLLDYPEPTDASKDIEALVERHGWVTFLRGLAIYVQQRTKIMPQLGYKLSNVKDINTKIMGLKTVVK